MKKIVFLLFAHMGLSACVAPYSPQDLPALSAEQVLLFQLDKLDKSGHVVQTSLLSIQATTDGSTRWTQTDAFGVPQARFIATPKGWQKEGFIMPNRNAQKVFTAMLPHLQRGFRQPETIHNVLITPLENE